VLCVTKAKRTPAEPFSLTRSAYVSIRIASATLFLFRWKGALPATARSAARSFTSLDVSTTGAPRKSASIRAIDSIATSPSSGILCPTSASCLIAIRFPRGSPSRSTTLRTRFRTSEMLRPLSAATPPRQTTLLEIRLLVPTPVE
jgi:hypothetical protein